QALAKGRQLSPGVLGEILCTALFFSNRSSHCAPGGKSPCIKMCNQGKDLTILHAIGAWAFQHIEAHTPKLGYKV
ncbi:unnamed protein product, partial [Scytosiphon promiscuus]